MDVPTGGGGTKIIPPLQCCHAPWVSQSCRGCVCPHPSCGAASGGAGVGPKDAAASPPRPLTAPLLLLICLIIS